MTKKGSMTVFLSLTLLIVLSLLFTLLESARVDSLDSSFSLDARLLAESAFTQYDTALYEQYDLFLLDGNCGGDELNVPGLEAQLQQLGEENLTIPNNIWNTGTGVSLLKGELADCGITAYELATDQEGAAFYRLVTDYMKETITQQVAREIYTQVTEAQKADEEAGDLDQRRDDADEGIELVKKELFEATKKSKKEQTQEQVSKQAQARQESYQSEYRSAEVSKNEAASEVTPMDQVRDMKNDGILSLVIADVSSISQKAIQTDTLIENRTCNSGTYAGAATDRDWYERILYNEYVVSHFTDYTAPNTDGALSYEQEYILVGKSSDKENLTGVAERLLAIREAVNYVKLKKNPTKCAEALTLATTLAGATGNAIVIKVVQEGILAAWAFADSVTDVKKLFGGERISIVEGKAGLDYEGYMRILLFLKNQSKQNYRCMNMIEQNMRLEEGRDSFQMDAMITQASFSFKYEAEPLFLSLVTLVDFKGDRYRFAYQEKYSYLTG